MLGSQKGDPKVKAGEKEAVCPSDCKANILKEERKMARR